MQAQKYLFTVGGGGPGEDGLEETGGVELMTRVGLAFCIVVEEPGLEVTELGTGDGDMAGPLSGGVVFAFTDGVVELSVGPAVGSGRGSGEVFLRFRLAEKTPFKQLNPIPTDPYFPLKFLLEKCLEISPR